MYMEMCEERGTEEVGFLETSDVFDGARQSDCRVAVVTFVGVFICPKHTVQLINMTLRVSLIYTLIHWVLSEFLILMTVTFVGVLFLKSLFVNPDYDWISKPK